jgi:hypothetical protein
MQKVLSHAQRLFPTTTLTYEPSSIQTASTFFVLLSQTLSIAIVAVCLSKGFHNFCCAKEFFPVSPDLLTC